MTTERQPGGGGRGRAPGGFRCVRTAGVSCVPPDSPPSRTAGAVRRGTPAVAQADGVRLLDGSFVLKAALDDGQLQILMPTRGVFGCRQQEQVRLRAPFPGFAPIAANVGGALRRQQSV